MDAKSLCGNAFEIQSLSSRITLNLSGLFALGLVSYALACFKLEAFSGHRNLTAGLTEVHQTLLANFPAQCRTIHCR